MLTVRDKNVWNRFRDDRWSGPNYSIPGRTLYVAPTTAYVSGYTVASAQSWARDHNALVYDTINLAYAAAVDGRGDTIVLLPGTHTPTASIALSKNNLSIVGAESWCGRKVRKPTSIIVAPAGDEAFNITGANAYFDGLTVVPVTTKAFADFTGAADGLTIKNCFIDLFTPAVNTGTIGFSGSAGIDNFLFEGNLAWSDGAQGPAVALTGLNNAAKFFKNHYHVDAGTWASAVNLADPDGITIEEELATCGGTAMTACFTASGTTVVAGVVFKDCRKGVLVTLLVDGFGTTSHAEIVNNYTATIGGGAGGTIIQVIT